MQDRLIQRANMAASWCSGTPNSAADSEAGSEVGSKRQGQEVVLRLGPAHRQAR